MHLYSMLLHCIRNFQVHQYQVIMRIDFRLFEVGDRDLTSFDREIKADISSALDKIIVKGKLQNKNIVAQKVYCILLKIYEW